MTLQTLQFDTPERLDTPEHQFARAGQQPFVISDTEEALLHWNSATAALAIWSRTPPKVIAEGMDQLALDTFQGWHLTTHEQDIEEKIQNAMKTCTLLGNAVQSFLTADMIRLGQLFVAATHHENLEVRFDVVTDNACRKFHTDRYPERLAVTYRGPGTVAVPSDHAEDALQDQQDYDGPLLEIPQFCAALFAGKRDDRPGLVHRSPQIAGTDHARLFFCINAAKS